MIQNIKHKGILAAVLAASGYSISLVSAGLSFRAGADPATVVTIRGVIGLLIGILMVRFLHSTLKLQANAITPLILMTLGMTGINYGYMGAIVYIPISLATLIFYMFPMAVLVVSSLSARRMPGAFSCLAFLIAFAGLALALGSSSADLDWRGVGLALVATAGGTLMFFYGAKVAARAGIALFTIYSQAAIASLGIVVMLALDGPNLPTGTTGSYALIGVCAGYMIGVTLQFYAVRLIDPALAALVFNVEPVVTISLSALLLGDLLSVTQYIGGAFVIGGVLLATRVASAPSPAPNDNPT